MEIKTINMSQFSKKSLIRQQQEILKYIEQYNKDVDKQLSPLHLIKITLIPSKKSVEEGNKIYNEGRESGLEYDNIHPVLNEIGLIPTILKMSRGK